MLLVPLSEKVLGDAARRAEGETPAAAAAFAAAVCVTSPVLPDVDVADLEAPRTASMKAWICRFSAKCAPSRLEA